MKSCLPKVDKVSAGNTAFGDKRDNYQCLKYVRWDSGRESKYAVELRGSEGLNE